MRSRVSILPEEFEFCSFPIGRVDVPDNDCNAVMVSGRLSCFKRIENQLRRPEPREGAEVPLEHRRLPCSPETYGRYEVSLISRAIGDFGKKAHGEWSRIAG